ncbi:MAG: hypothetical protein Q9219_007092 [cf. Caloplaca sp. 3 TL-2023]
MKILPINASQTVNNACASVALLNIVNNVPNLELGNQLEQFKRFTAEFTPALRGDAIGNFEFVKTVHNSFARKMDMLNADLQLKNDASSRKKIKRKSPANEDDAAPTRSVVGLLTGLGSIAGSDWVKQVAPEIEARMAQYEEGQIEFAIMSLVKDPLTDLIAALAANVKSIMSLAQRLNCIKPDWEDLLAESMNGTQAATLEIILGPCEHYRLPQRAIDRAELSPGLMTRLKRDGLEELMAARNELITAQAGLRASIRDEMKAIRIEDERAATRRNDKGLLAKGLLTVIGRVGRTWTLFDYDKEVWDIG